MFTRTTLFASLLLASQVFAGTATTVATTPEVTSPAEDPFFNGSFTAAYTTNYTGRGYLVTNVGIEGEGADRLLLKLDHKIDESKWSYEALIAYTICNSGHTLYGNPSYNPSILAAGYLQAQNIPVTPQTIAAALATGQFNDVSIHDANLENEFVISQEMRYREETWSVGIGFDYIHGGLLGVMAKHYADYSMSCVGEFFISPEYSPTQWLTLACPIRYSAFGMQGWWFEPSVTFKAPLIGTPEDVKLAALLSFNISATGDYFQSYHGACNNGTQAFWIQLSTPYFVNQEKNLIITPSVSFNWAGKGALGANKHSRYAMATGNDAYVPFQNFGVVGTISCTYKF